MAEPYATKPPANYGERSSDFAANPSLMWASARNVQTYIDAVVDEWLKIAKIWEDLKISWAGQSAEAAQELNERLRKLQVELFGRPKTDAQSELPGILTEVRAAADRAAQIYDTTETNINGAWRRMYEALVAENPPPPQDTTGVPPISLTMEQLPQPEKKK